MHIPQNAVHTYKNISDTCGKLLTMATPGKPEDYFRAVGQRVKTATDIPDLNTAPDFASLDVADFIALAPDYEVTFHVPEIA